MTDTALTVDSTNRSLAVSFLDDRGDTTAAPTGSSATYASDNSAVATVDPTSGAITVVSEGTFNGSVALSNALEADGVTEIPDPAPLSITVGPGPAASASLTVN